MYFYVFVFIFLYDCKIQMMFWECIIGNVGSRLLLHAMKVRLTIPIHICHNSYLYLSQFQFIFVTIHIFICHNSYSYLSQFIYVFVTISIHICPNSYLYLSQFQFVFAIQDLVKITIIVQLDFSLFISCVFTENYTL